MSVIPPPRPTGGAAASDEDGYRALFESALFGLGVADMEGNLLAFNDAMLAPGGYTREDIAALGGNVSRLYARAEDRDRIFEMVRTSGRVWREEVQFVRKDGTPYDTLLTLIPVQFCGRPCLAATVEDVTELKRSERQRQALEAKLWRAQKMEAVGRMTAGIAHDFKNILAIILSCCELLERTAAASDPEVAPHLADLREAARRGAAMIGKLLGFSRTAALEVTPTDLADLTTRMQGMLRRIVPTQIRLEVHAESECVALCDPNAVEQMILNLVTNARDAMPKGGRLRIGVGPWSAAREERPAWLPAREYARITVVDEGIGMDEEMLARATEPFFTTKPAGAGTGLGLPMVFGLAKQQGGYLDISSEPGVGTTVHLYFPRLAT